MRSDYKGIQFTEEDLRRMYVDEGLTIPQIAKTLGSTTKTVVNHMHKNGIRTRRIKLWLQRLKYYILINY